jgi:hypothetical protein
MKLHTLMLAAVFTLGSSVAFAQGGGGGGGGGGSAGGGAGGASGGTSGAAASPRAGSAGAGSLGTSGVPNGPANAAGLNNSGNDPSGGGRAPTFNSDTTTGLANSSRGTPANGQVRNPENPPGTNSAGTAYSSGEAPGGGGTLRSNGTRMPGANGPTTTKEQDSDAQIDKENQKLDRMVKSICKGC